MYFSCFHCFFTFSVSSCNVICSLQSFMIDTDILFLISDTDVRSCICIFCFVVVFIVVFIFVVAAIVVDVVLAVLLLLLQY